MVEIVISVAAKIAEYLVAPVGRPFRYLWNYKTNLENLKNEVKKLEAKRHTVQLSIKPGENPMPDVKLWQERVNRIIVQVSEVVGGNPEQANIQCCKGFSCPNLMNHYQLSKKAGKLKSDVVDLEQEAAKFKEVSYPTILEEPWLRSSKGYDAFESRTSILKNIIDALRDPDVNMVGIYGMGGIGKTTLAKEVARHTKQDNLFHVIVFVEVSKTTDIQHIQQDIGRQLGLSFDGKSEDERARARALYDKLKKEVTISERADNSGEEKKEKKFLLILDNIWEKIDLERVGIPLGGDCKGLKLLLTARNIHVLTNQMECYCNFSVETLDEAEAWSLFKSAAGMCVDHPDLESIAPEVAKKCGNMPLAIVTIAKALKNRETYAWVNALQKLKNPPLEGFKDMMTKEVYTCIQFSYDSLDTDELREIFLLCSRMGRTYDASIRDLFMYGLGLGFFKRSNTLEEAQCEVEDLVKQLKDNSLLLDAPNETRESLWHVIPEGERFAMHDVICDVARLIDREKGNVCNVINDVILCNWDMLKNCTSITLHDISKVPKDLQSLFPQLKFFYMKTKNAFSAIPDNFFAKMSRLQVLHLIEMNLSPLPTSLSSLVNLQTLCLDTCDLGDIADIGKLEKLKILSFRGSKFKKLSEEMRHLTSIRLLDLTDCSTLEIIPPDVISSCFTQLEALYMYNTLIMWEVRGLNIGRILDELKHLRDRLTTFEINIPNVKMSEGLLSRHLKRYKISIDRDRISPPKNSRTLRVKLNTNDDADEVISQLKGIKQLELGCADRRYGFTADSKQSVSLDALFSLESLSLEDLNFVKICNVPLVAESFCQLRTITVDGCDKLTHIFSFSIDRILPKLQEIRVSFCRNMEGIFAIEREDDVNNSELIHEIQFSQLCSVTLGRLPQLKSFCHRVKTTSQLQLTSSTNDGEIISEDMIDIPKSLFNEKVVFPNLETLKIFNIGAEKIWHNQLPTMSSSFQTLNRLAVYHCDNLKELFPSSMFNSFVQLQYLEIYECSLLEEVVFMEELKEEERKDTQFPFLKEMKIIDCPNFKGFISNDKIGFPSLKAMKIKKCPKFKKFIFNDKVAVPNVEKLTIFDMDNLEKIWHDQLVKDSFCKLKSLKVDNCQKLLNVFPSNICGRLLSSLESLEVDSCGSLEEIFDLRELSIYDSQIMLSFENLQRLEISWCASLKNMFSAFILAKEGVVMEEAPARFHFPKLLSLELSYLPNLRSFYPGRHKLEGPVLKTFKLLSCGIHEIDEIGFPSLKEMEIKWCLKLKEFIFNDKVVFPNLETLVISDIGAAKIWHNQLPMMSSSFQNLNRLDVHKCDNLKELFPSSMVNSFVQLQYLKISFCSLLEEMVFMEELKEEERKDTQFPFLKKMTIMYCPNFKRFISNDKIGFPTLKEMEIERCRKFKEFIFNDKVVFPKLETLKISYISAEKIWHNQLPTMSSFFQNLNRLDVNGCDNLKELFSSSMVNSFIQLQYLKIFECSLLEEMVFMEELREEGRKDTQFPLLKEMKITNCPNFKAFISNDKIGFPSLKAMEIEKCPKFKKFIFNDKVAVLNLEELRISYMNNLEKIWHDQLVKDSFCKLKSLKVDHCQKLLNVFPSNICGRLLSSLESLEVHLCGSLEEIFDLRELSIYDSQIMLSFESLQEMRVSSCLSLKNMFSAFILAKEGVVMEEAPARFHFPKLLSLELSYLQNLRSFYPGRHKLEGPVLKTFKLLACGIHEIDEIGFPSLKEMEITMCPKLKEFIYNDKVAVPNIEKLTISFMDNLEKIWHSQLVNDSFCKLKSLEVYNCKKLLNVFPSNICGRLLSLESLEVSNCDSLINMGTSSVAKSLLQLTKMSISDCKKITEVIGNHGDVIEDEIIFRKLKSLMLQDLPSLTSFYSWNFTLKFPSLETLTVQGCPHMKIFSRGDLTTEKLQEVKIDWVSVKLRPDFNLNAATQQSNETAKAYRRHIFTEDNGASFSDYSE